MKKHLRFSKWKLHSLNKKEGWNKTHLLLKAVLAWPLCSFSEMTDSSGQANMERPPRNFPSKAKESISSQPKKRFRGTLAIFIQALEGMRIVVELRQDTIVRGLLETADNDMNLTMREVTMTPLEGTKQNLDWLYIKGHHIRLNLERFQNLLSLFGHEFVVSSVVRHKRKYIWFKPYML